MARRDEIRFADVRRRKEDGQRPKEIVREVAAQYGVNIRTVWTDLSRIEAEYAQVRPELIEASRAKHLERLNSARRRAVIKGKTMAEIRILDQQARVLGLYQTPPDPAPPAATTPADRVRDLTTTEMRQRLTELLGMIDERAVVQGRAKPKG